MENFENLNDVETKVEETDAKKDDRKALTKRKKAAFIKKVQENPEFAAELNTLSDTLEVVNALGHPSVKGVIKGENKPDGSRTLETVMGIVGYTLVNKGTEPLTYLTEVFTKDENGDYVGEQVKRVAKPGESFDLSKKYFTILTSAPAFAFKLANGTVRRGSRTANGVEEEFLSYYFKPNDADLKVNSDEFKLNIGVKGEDGTLGVKDKYLESFGFLCNKPEKGSGRSSGNSRTVTQQDIAANYVQSLLNGEMI